jgi:hypothetical protein
LVRAVACAAQAPSIAAAKLEFEVAPANFISGVYYRIISLFQQYQPWRTIVLAAVSFIVLVNLFKKFFSFEINFKKKEKQNE